MYLDKDEYEFLANASDARCNLLTQHLIEWELTAIFAPHLHKIDLMDLLLKVKGGAPFLGFVVVGGRTYVKIRRQELYER